MPQSDDSGCKGPYATLSGGGSLTLAALLGVNISANINISHSTSINWSNPLQSLQISGSLQIAGMAGYGGFAGAGLTAGGGISSGPSTPGLSTSSAYYAEGDLGAGAAVGGSVQANKPIGSGASGAVGTKYGAGVGIYAGVGKAGAVTYASKPLGCP